MVSVLDQYRAKRSNLSAPAKPVLSISTPDNPGAGAFATANAGPVNSAVGQGMGIQATRPMAEIQQTPQQVQSGDWRSNKSSSIYGVLRSVDAMGESALNLTNARLQAFNARRSAENRNIMRQNESFMNSQNDVWSDGGGGGSFGAGILAPDQEGVARSIIEIGRQRGMSEDDIKIGLMTGLAESGLRNVNHGDRDSLGVFQQRPSQGWGSPEQVSNVNYATNKFYDALSKTNRTGVTHWQAAQNVQRSAFADGSNYRAQANKAYQIYGAYRQAPRTTGVTNGGPVNAAAGTINSLNNRYLDFDGAYGAQCVDLFNYYNQGFVGGGFITGVSGAKDIWGNPNMNKNYVAMSANARPQMGDVVVWGGSMGGGYGHVGIVTGYNSDGTIRTLQSNATPAGSRGNSIISNMSRNGVLGYYRPRKLMG